MKIIDFGWPWKSVLQQKLCRLYRVFISKRFYCKKHLRNLRPIFPLVIYDCSYLYRLATPVILPTIINLLKITFYTKFCI